MRSGLHGYGEQIATARDLKPHVTFHSYIASSQLQPAILSKTFSILLIYDICTSLKSRLLSTTAASELQVFLHVNVRFCWFLFVVCLVG